MSGADEPTRARTEVMVPTVRGEVPSAALGPTLMHEHTFCVNPEVNTNFPETWGDEEQRVSDAIRQYQELKARGVDTVVDVTVLGLGRDIPRIQRIAAQTDLNIVVASGLYIWSDVPLFFAVQGPGTLMGGPEILTDMLVGEIENGIADTGVRPAIIKVATHADGLTPAVTRVLRASAGAHRRTGIPITTHTHREPNGLQQQHVFREDGVDLSRVVIGHVTFSAADNLDYIRELIANRSYVGFDQFKPVEAIGALMRSRGMDPRSDDYRTRLHATEERDARVLDGVVTLVDEGHIGQIVLSLDHSCFCDMVPPDMFDCYSKGYLLEAVLPALRDRGITDDQVTTMMVSNPRRIFESAALGAY